MRRLLRSCMGLSVLLIVPHLRADEGTPFVYQGGGGRTSGKASLEWGTGVGTRDAGPLGDRGFTRDLRVVFGIADSLSADLGGGALFKPGGDVRSAYHGELRLRLLREESVGFNLALSAGLAHDFRNALVPSVRIALDKSLGRFSLSGSGLLEFPLAAGRDPLDVLVSLAGSYAITSQFKIGVEAAGEDIEGFWARGEAEGGARMLAGPSVWIEVWRDFTVRVNAAGVVVMQQAPSGAVTPLTSFQGRVVLAFQI